MVNFSQLIQQNREHDRLAHQQTTRHNRQQTPLVNYSCIECYSAEHVVRIQFEHFWNWYQTIYPAVSFSENTQLAFYRLLDDTADDIATSIYQIITSIRYSTTPDSSYLTIQDEILRAYNITQQFWSDPALELYAVSEYVRS